jgi:tRNA 2-thiouridine synthesizing protein E
MNEEAKRDGEGYLIDPAQWNDEIAHQFATEEGIVLTDEYWSILNFMRDYWREHQVAPDVRHVVEYFANMTDMDKKAAKSRVFEMFPYGYVKQACKISGMMRPRAWSTG